MYRVSIFHLLLFLLLPFAGHTINAETSVFTASNACTSFSKALLPVPGFNLPSTDIWLFDLSYADGIALSTPRNITNRPGYDNQPSFAYSGKQILYTADRNGQTDIFRYHIAKGTTTRLTNTPESEFSPIMMHNKTHFSTVRVERDSSQRLWMFNMHGANPNLINKKIKQVGYHCWMGTNNYALFVINKPYNELHVGMVHGKTTTKVFDNIGRCMQKVPDKSELSFTQVNKDGTTHTITTMNIYTHEISVVTKCVGESQDFAWLPDGSLLMVDADKLYHYHPEKGKEWKMVHAFDAGAFNNITRIAVSADGNLLALVANEIAEK